MNRTGARIRSCEIGIRCLCRVQTDTRCVGLSSSALRAVSAWAKINGIKGESLRVSAAGSLRNGESNVAVAPRDDDLDGHGPVHGVLRSAVFLCRRSGDRLVDQLRAERRQLT